MFMNKKKIISTTILIIVYVTNVFASIVSDNDGSAFVTKAEFEALKYSFNEEIENYNTSIDSKIDGAISSYLAGINIEYPPVELWSRLKTQMGDVWFSNKLPVGEASITTNDKISLNRHFTLKKYNNLIQTIYLQFANPIFPNAPSDYAMQAGTGYTSRIEWWFNNEVGVGTKRHNGGYIITGTYLRYDDDASTWFGTDRDVRMQVNIPNVEAWNSVGWNRGGWGASRHTDELTTAKFNHLQNKTIETTGSGSYYEYYTNPAGYKVLRNYYTDAYPVYDLNVTAHTYRDFACNNVDDFRNIYCERTGKSDNTNLTYTVEEKSKFGSYVFGDESKVRDDSEETIAYYANLSMYQVKTSDGKDYGVYLIGKNSNQDVYCLDRLASFTVQSQTTVDKSQTVTTFQENQNLLTGEEACTQNLSGCELKYKSIKLTPEILKLKNFINEYVTTIAGETTYLGGGIPIIDVLSEDQSLRVKIKFKSRNENGASANSQIKYTFSDKQFDNCSVASGAGVLAEGTVATGTEIELRLESLKKGNVWMNFYSETDGYSASIDTISVSVI